MRFFKRGEIVTIDHGTHRWAVDRIVEHTGATLSGDVDMVQVAELSDADGNRTTARTDRLTKVAG